MKRVLFFIWQLPQNLIGLIVILFTKASKDDALFGVWRTNKKFGVRLGDFIIINTTASIDSVKHEQGHQKQSLYFGPLYLLIVGIPSAIFCNLWDRLFHRQWSSETRSRWYYSHYPECWADKAMGCQNLNMGTVDLYFGGLFLFIHEGYSK